MGGLAISVHCAGRCTVEWTLAIYLRRLDEFRVGGFQNALWAVVDALMLVPSLVQW